MKTNKAGIDLIKKFEGCVLKVYLDPIGLPTVGYGHYDKTMTPGLEIPQELADKLLEADLAVAEKAVQRRVIRKPTENQFSAMVSFVFNIGEAKFAKSTLLKKFNAGDIDGAGLEFLKWDKAGGMTLPGLHARRKAEAELFLST